MMTTKLGRLPPLAFLIGSVFVLFASLSGEWLEPLPRAWGLTLGFGLLVVGSLSRYRTLVIPLLVTLTLFVYCGLSALVAQPQTPATVERDTRGFTEEQIRSVAPAAEFETLISGDGFHDAALITGVGGLVLFWSVLLLTLYAKNPGVRRIRSPDVLLRVGKVLVFAGYLGVLAALVRFIIIQDPSQGLFANLKSFWIGGTIFLLIATFAVPGFALWFQGLFGRGAPAGKYWQPAALALLWVCLLVPTGQRLFVVAIGLMLMAVLLGNRIIRVRAAVGMVLAAVLLIGMTQALRNEAREEGQITATGFLKRVTPGQWQALYGGQIQSFNLTVVIAQNRGKLDIPNSFVALLEKPIPRSILPEKSQGFGAEFTSQVYPGVFEQDISFAVPFFAEAEFNLGFPGMVLALLLLGVVIWGAGYLFASRAPPLVEPIVLVTIFWFVFSMVRGDTANAVIITIAWVFPLAIFSRPLGLRGRPEPKRIVIDATQVSPQFSGIGRRVIQIGESLRREPLDLPVEVVCARDVRGMLSVAFPQGTVFKTPLASSRPRARRILFQQLLLPVRYRAKTVLLSPGDQAPIWGSSPLIFVIHDTRRLDLPETASSGLEASFYQLIMSVGARRAAAIITISRFSESRVRKLFQPHCPVEIVTSSPDHVELVEESKLREAAPLFLVLGAVRRYKGAETVARAVLEVSKAHGHITPRVHFVGEVEEELAPGLVAELDGEANGAVRFEGWLEDSTVADLASGFVGAIHASEYEGYGLPVAETLAMGLPTIASDIPPHREIGGDAVRYFSAGDTAVLADLILELAGHPELRVEMSRAARRRARELRQVSNTWAGVLRSALGNARQP